MVSASIEQLLILQDRDARCEHVKKLLTQIPHERATTDREIAEERARIALLEAGIEQLRARNQALEGDVAEAEARVVKYKTQQLEVKKNDEYQALDHEIAVIGARVAELEDEQLDLLEQIDEQCTALAALKIEVAQGIATFEAHLRTLAETESVNQGQLDDAVEAVGKARTQTDEAALKVYDFVKGQVKRAPYVCPIEGNKCMGCHLRVSGDVESQARRSHELARCDSCGRIVYVDR